MGFHQAIVTLISCFFANYITFLNLMMKNKFLLVLRHSKIIRLMRVKQYGKVIFILTKSSKWSIG
jgi:hypothetical protein